MQKESLENVLWKINHINLLEKLSKYMPKICINCNKSYEDHSESELLDCYMDIVKSMQKDLINQQQALADRIATRKIKQ